MNQVQDKKLLSIGKVASMLGISVDTLRRWDKSGKLAAIKLGGKGTRYYRLEDIHFLLQKPSAIARKWVESRVAYTPSGQYYCETRDTFKARNESFREVLKRSRIDNPFLLAAITGEIGNNSYDHNIGDWTDIMGTFFAFSLGEKQVVLADRGQGLLRTLQRVKPELKNDHEALIVAFTEKISGRYPENRGNGLKFVKQALIRGKFSLLFQTGDSVLRIEKNDELNVQKVENTIVGCLCVINY